MFIYYHCETTNYFSFPNTIQQVIENERFCYRPLLFKNLGNYQIFLRHHWRILKEFIVQADPSYYISIALGIAPSFSQFFFYFSVYLIKKNPQAFLQWMATFEGENFIKNMATRNNVKCSSFSVSL